MTDYFYSSDIPDYIKQDFDRYGYHFDTTSEVFDKNIIFYEREIPFVLKNIDRLKQKKIIIIIDHHFVYHSVLKKLDDTVIKGNVWLIGTQYLAPLYNNLQTTSIGSSELWCKHDVMKYVIDRWLKCRTPNQSKQYLLMASQGTMPYHVRRNNFVEELKQNMKDKLFDFQTLRGDKLWDKKREFENWIEQTFGNRNMLGGFGSGLPRFDLYDQISAELVLETVYETKTVHLSEKTWRPIACRVPAVFLLNSTNIKHLKELGYKLSSFIYEKLKMINSYEEMMALLREELDNLDHDQLRQDAEYNYNHFWRYHSVWTDFVPNLKQIFGYAPIEEIAERLNQV